MERLLTLEICSCYFRQLNYLLDCTETLVPAVIIRLRLLCLKRNLSHLKLVWFLNNDFQLGVFPQHRFSHLRDPPGFLLVWCHLPVWYIWAQRARGSKTKKKSQWERWQSKWEDAQLISMLCCTSQHTNKTSEGCLTGSSSDLFGLHNVQALRRGKMQYYIRLSHSISAKWKTIKFTEVMPT